MIMMKRIAFIFLSLVLAIGAVNAQNSKRTSAYMYNKNGKLDKAQASIEEAILHEKTKDDPKTWYYRGLIYLNIATTQKEKFQGLSDNPVGIAFESLKRAEELDSKETFKKDILVRLSKIGELFFNQGVADYNKSAWIPAANNFEKAFLVGQEFGTTDTSALRNVTLTLSSALKEAEEADKPALEKKVADTYKQLIGFEMKDPNIYSEYANILIANEEYDAALEIIQKGRQLSPKNFNLIVAEANVYLKKEDSKNAIQVLNEAIALDPTNGTVYAAAANMYANVTRDTATSKEERDIAFAEAEKNFKKAIEITPNFDNYFNLGALFYNRGADTYAYANELPFDDPTYPELEKAAKEDLANAVPYLEKARELNPDDVWVLRSLKEVYLRTKQNDKFKEINDKLKEVEAR